MFSKGIFLCVLKLLSAMKMEEPGKMYAQQRFKNEIVKNKHKNLFWLFILDNIDVYFVSGFNN